MEQSWDVIVIGGGPAGLAAALAAEQNGAERVLLLERNDDLGGILNQCIHNGFGLHHFKQELTGPEYAGRFIRQIEGSGVRVLCGAMALELAPGGAGHGRHLLRAMQGQAGYLRLAATAVVLAMGCRERTRGAIGIPGDRPAGVFTAGAAQLYINIEGWQLGSRAVILGSGDIGLIMARRLTLEGARVLGVYEIMPYSGGLARNRVQCLEDYGIPLHLSHTITQIRGDKRVEQVVVARVDAQRRPIPGSEQTLDCDTVLLSVGLIPENELSRKAGLAIDRRTGGPVVFENMETSAPGVFACGNVAHVHDLVDFVTAESVLAGRNAGTYCADCAAEKTGEKTAQKNRAADGATLRVENGPGVGYVLPQRLRTGRVGEKVELFFRVRQPSGPATIQVMDGGAAVAAFRRDHLAPGEMERITLPKKMLDKIENNTLKIQIKEDENQGGEAG